jgi:hypothetical protein
MNLCACMHMCMHVYMCTCTFLNFNYKRQDTGSFKHGKYTSSYKMWEIHNFLQKFSAHLKSCGGTLVAEHCTRSFGVIQNVQTYSNKNTHFSTSYVNGGTDRLCIYKFSYVQLL